MNMRNSRFIHCAYVGKKMHDIVKKFPNMFDITPEEAYTVGYLHDIGYAFADGSEHSKVGGIILKGLGYRYWEEIYWHGIPHAYHTSSVLNLLNYADMTVGPNGEDFTMEERIREIGERYGFDSDVRVESALIADELAEFTKMIEGELSSTHIEERNNLE